MHREQGQHYCVPKFYLREALREFADDIPDEEKIRLIKSTGLFNKLKEAEKEHSEQIDQNDPFHYGFTFQAFIYTIPLCAVYSMLDVVVHRQYNEEVTFIPFSTRVVKIAPLLWVFVYYTNKYANKNWLQVLMFLGSILCGCHLIWVINKANYYGVMRRCPSLATLWVYFVVQLRLLPSVLSLGVVYFQNKRGQERMLNAKPLLSTNGCVAMLALVPHRQDVIKDFLGEDQNADITRRIIRPFYFGTSIKVGNPINIMMACFKKLAEQNNLLHYYFAENT
ncbi:9341_t:CDS:2, partial [Dentiscutata erythropus]